MVFGEIGKCLGCRGRMRPASFGSGFPGDSLSSQKIMRVGHSNLGGAGKVAAICVFRPFFTPIKKEGDVARNSNEIRFFFLISGPNLHILGKKRARSPRRFLNF